MKTINCDQCHGAGEISGMSYPTQCEKCGGTGKLTEQGSNDEEDYREYLSRCCEDLGSAWHYPHEVLRWCFQNPRKMKAEEKSKCIHSWFSTGHGENTFRCAHCGTTIELR